MPTYAYACKQCGHRFDIVQSFSDAALTECPECGGTLRKQFGTVGVTFNGSGFYRTDSRAGGGAGGSTATSSKSEATSSPAAAGS
ncbi:FmdB family zinc ribbon protein [Microbacterium sp. PA5]|uniref:FmdB family zinc ribbon protein n=1 Tax=Microbacterium sp. PA5 TaxID=3416654 RepID=UPI003CEA1BA6